MLQVEHLSCSNLRYLLLMLYVIMHIWGNNKNIKSQTITNISCTIDPIYAFYFCSLYDALHDLFSEGQATEAETGYGESLER